MTVEIAVPMTGLMYEDVELAAGRIDIAVLTVLVTFMGLVVLYDVVLIDVLAVDRDPVP